MDVTNEFSLIIALGASFGLFQVALVTRPSQRADWLLASLLTLFGALVGARLGYVLENLHYFAAHAGQIVCFWQGGITWESAFAGGLLTLLAVRAIWKWSYFSLLDRISLLLLPMGAAAWMGCWLSGAAYGLSLPAGTWWAVRAIDEAGTMALRTPLQLLAAVSLVVLLGFTELLTRSHKLIGFKGSLLALIFSADMLFFSFFRADPAQIFLGLRFESWAAMVYTLIGALALLWILYKDGKLVPIINFGNRVITWIRKLHEIKPRTRTN